MTDPKKPASADINDLKARLGLVQGGEAGSSQPLGGSGVPPPTGLVPPPVGFVPPPGGIAPPGAAASPANVPVPGASSPSPGERRPSSIPPPPGLGAPPGQAMPAPNASPPVASAQPQAQLQRTSNVPPPAGGFPSPQPPGGAVVPPPSFAPPGGASVPLPAFAQKPDIAPPPFAQEEEIEEEFVREEKVVKIEADDSMDEREAGKLNLAPFAAVGVTLILSALIGYLGGSQIDRAVRANRAVDAAIAIHDAVLQDQEVAKGLKSRISGAARRAMDANEPAADFTLLAYLSKISKERPFTAQVWSSHFYQAFKSRQLVFEYYRSAQELYDIIGEVAVKYQEPGVQASLKAWPANRQKILEINHTKGASGYGVAFDSKNGDVFGIAGIFKNSRQDRDRFKSEFVPLGGGAEKTLTEFQPSDPDLSKSPSDYFVRVNPDVVVGIKRQVLSPGGPVISEEQDPYRQYLSDLNQLSKAIQIVQGNQDNLIQALTDIRVAPRPFTFGFY